MDRHGLPLPVSTHAANQHEVTLVQLSSDFYMLESKPENLIGDKAYDSNALDESLKQQGVEMIAPHPSNQQLLGFAGIGFNGHPNPLGQRVAGGDRSR